MNSLRLFIVGILLILPFFTFAQISTSTVEQPYETASLLQQQIDQITTSRINLLPKIEDIQKNAISDLLDVKISPNNPGPNETIRIKIESYLSDMNKALITWKIDGRVVQKGIGKTSLSFQNSPSGKTTKLTVTILTNAGDEIIKNFSWTPVGVTIFWEADTYTPPFYRGKALLSPQARVKVVATPDNTGTKNALDAGNLVYIWVKDGTSVAEASGYGKNLFSFVGHKPYDESNVKVRVSSVDNTINSEVRTYLPLSKPFILFYNNNPLLGVLYNRPLNNTISFSEKELSIRAEPYFFSNEHGEIPTLKYGWYVNGKNVQNFGRNITLLNETGSKGVSDISLAMRGVKQTFQTANQSLRVNFTGSTTASTKRPIF